MKRDIEFSLDLFTFHMYNRDKNGKDVPKTYTLRILEFGAQPKYRSLLHLRLCIDKTIGVVLFIEFFIFSNVFILRKGNADLILNKEDDETYTSKEPRYTGIIEGMEWINWVARDKDGDIYAYSQKPKKGKSKWEIVNCRFEKINSDQSILLCKRLPWWNDNEPTPVKK